MSYRNYDKDNRETHRERRKPIQSVIVSTPDRTLFVVVMFLVIIGFMAIFSASAPKCLDEGVNPAQFLIKQMFCFVIGFVGLKLLTNYDYKKLFKWNSIVAVLIIIALLLVDFTPLGVTVNGAKRWINLFGFQLQPSEFAKPAVVLLLAAAFKDNGAFFDEKKWIRYFIPIIIMVLLIFMQPNLSMVILLFSVCVVMYLCGGGSLKFFFTCLALGGAAATFAFTAIIKPYQLQRIKIWRHPEIDPLGAGYNIIQSLIAFASGGFHGVGYGSSIQKLAYLPECHTDFIFAVIAEEFGWIGCLLIIGLFWTFIHRGFIVASRCPDMYGRLLAIGITFAIGFQALLNISVASAFAPATGVPLPFISYGGSSLIVSLCMVGILLNISKKRIKKIRNVDYDREQIK